MGVTMERALTSSMFHQDGPGPSGRPCDSPKGPVRWRRNGKTKTWKTRPGEFRIPVKWGLKICDYIDQTTVNVHAEEDCPAKVPETACPKVHDPIVGYGSVSRCVCGHGKRSACHGWS